MARNAPIIITGMIVVTLFVLLAFPAIIPINAPPVLKTFKDMFVGVLSLVMVLLTFVLLRDRISVDAFQFSESTFNSLSLPTLRC